MSWTPALSKRGSSSLSSRSRIFEHRPEARRFGHPVRDVDAEAVDAAIQPEPQRLLEIVQDLGVVPVEVRLLGVEQVQVPLAGLPSGSTTRVQAGPPKMLGQLFGGWMPPGPVPSRKRYRSRCGAAGPGRQRLPGTTGAPSWCGWAPDPS